MTWRFQVVARTQMKGEKVGRVCYNDSNGAVQSQERTYYIANERLPSWREFSKGIPNCSEPPGFYIPLATTGSNYTMYHSVQLKYPKPVLVFQSYVSPPSYTSPQKVSSQVYPLTSSIFPNDLRIQLGDIADFTTPPQRLFTTYRTTQRCNICGRGISGDLDRHIRMHTRETSFKCLYPRAFCSHRTGYFHRKYDLKKHLLHNHFCLGNSKIKRLKSLTDKLQHEGICPCGERMKAGEWLMHIFARDLSGNFECRDLMKKLSEDGKVNRK